jgi:hypothetical protein
MKRLPALCVTPFVLTALIAAASCGGEEERYEKVGKLRALGTASTPVVAQPSTADAPQTVTLTFYAAVPNGDTVTATPFLDEGSLYALPLPLEVVPGSETYTGQAAFQLYSVKTTVAIPTIDQLPIEPGTGFARVRYGLTLTDGGEEEKIVGTLLVYPEGSSELAWATTPPSIDVTEPAASATVSGKLDIKAAITNPIGEDMRVGWFVSDGEVKNRRAKETEWDKAGAGPQTVIVTARGMKTGAFTLKAVDVTVE